MTIYITPNNQLHDDAEGFALTLPSWPQDARIATQEEIDAILNPQETPEQTLARLKALKQSEIDQLEATLFMTRGEREAWLIQMETIATQQSVSLEVLYQANPFYKKLKDCDDAVTALRAELKAIV